MTAPNQPRLLPDVATLPTPRERDAARTYWRNAQADLFASTSGTAPTCPVCAGEHLETECKHGTAPVLFGPDVWTVEHRADELDNSPDAVAARRAMFQGFGWTR
jgi:hypothetical protein